MPCRGHRVSLRQIGGYDSLGSTGHGVGVPSSAAQFVVAWGCDLAPGLTACGDAAGAAGATGAGDAGAGAGLAAALQISHRTGRASP